MSFDIAQTPTLQAVATLDEELLVEDLQQRVETAARQAGEMPEVLAANAEERLAADRLAQLRRAERVLNHFAKETGDKLAEVRQRSLDALIESAGGTEKLDFKALNELAALDARGRQAIRAIETLVERRIPEAQLLHLREESHALSARARCLEQLAQERAEKLLEQLRAAVSEEVVLPVDLSKGVSGALLAQASEWKRQAVQLSESADALEKTLRRPI